MLNFNAVAPDFAPRQKIVSALSAQGGGLDKLFLTDEFDLAFLCGLLKTFRPRKIVEVGVAAGGSTATILQALEDLGAPYEFHSVDLFTKQKVYRNEPTGFLATLAKERIFGTLNGTHKLHLGKILPQVIDEIGDGVDFVFLDTVHRLPGEVLDFLAVSPYLTDDAVVVLHDVALHQHKNPRNDATGVLFSAVTANKFLNFLPDDELFRYPNIAAFQVNEHTAAYVENVFLSLILRWDYWPTDEQVAVYREHFRRFYADALLEIFQEAVDMNLYNIVMDMRK